MRQIHLGSNTHVKHYIFYAESFKLIVLYIKWWAKLMDNVILFLSVTNVEIVVYD